MPSGKYDRKRSDSCPSHSRCCTGLSSSRVSSSTVLYAAVPYSSCAVQTLASQRTQCKSWSEILLIITDSAIGTRQLTCIHTASVTYSTSWRCVKWSYVQKYVPYGISFAAITIINTTFFLLHPTTIVIQLLSNIIFKNQLCKFLNKLVWSQHSQNTIVTQIFRPTKDVIHKPWSCIFRSSISVNWPQ